ncbi:MAG: CBS domain-containing protein [Acidobacteria bacterium]|nr:MAG: CBS domain-containing protein [Acidobacteriota bacterium]
MSAKELRSFKSIGSLPVAKDGRLIGIVTERDFMDIERAVL